MGTARAVEGRSSWSGRSSGAKFCTGDGNARKETHAEVCVQALDIDTDDHNAADAVVLNRIGQALLAWYKPDNEYQLQVLDTIRASYAGSAKSKVKKAR
jgi:hypothetical protein